MFRPTWAIRIVPELLGTVRAQGSKFDTRVELFSVQNTFTVPPACVA
jgi:hypothetical protein